MSEINTGNYENLSATDIEAIKAAAKESAASMLRVDAERDLRKDIAKKIKEEYGIKPGDFNALATRYHRQDIAAQKAKFENQSELYQKVFNEGEDGEGEEDE